MRKNTLSGAPRALLLGVILAAFLLAAKPAPRRTST